MLVSALQKNGIKTEFHMFPEGGQPLGTCSKVTSNSDAQLLPHVGKWFDLAAEFLQSL